MREKRNFLKKPILNRKHNNGEASNSVKESFS